METSRRKSQKKARTVAELESIIEIQNVMHSNMRFEQKLEFLFLYLKKKHVLRGIAIFIKDKGRHRLNCIGCGGDSRYYSRLKKVKIPLNKEIGVIARTVLEGQTFCVQDAGTDERENQTVRKSTGLEKYISSPIYVEEEHLPGSLVLDYSEIEVNVADYVTEVSYLARLVGFSIGLAHRVEEIKKLARKNAGLANRDGLTGLYNYRYFMQRIKKLVTEKPQRKYSFMMIDLDYFKDFNDTYGHLVGDEILKEIADVLRKSVYRREDVLARYGGEEFGIFLVNSDYQATKERAAERLRKTIESHEFCFEAEGGRKYKVKLTASFGVSAYKGNIAEMISEGDRALYRAKDLGRNAVCGSEDPIPDIPGT